MDNNSTKRKISVVSKKILRERTNDNTLCKMYIQLLSDNDGKSAISIRKYILAKDNYDMCTKMGMMPLKKMNNAVLFYSWMSFKVGTFDNINSWVNSLTYLLK